MAPRRGASQDRDEDAGAPPDQAELRQAALSYLARYASTQAALARVLDKRIDTWARKKGSRY